MTDAIELVQARKQFGQTVAVRDLDLRVPTGSLCGFLGPNGAGKSTTIRMLMSIIYPDSGKVSVLGGSALDAKDRIGYLPEERGVYRKMRVREFLIYVARLKGLDAVTGRKRAEAWLERIKLPEVLPKRCEELSKGMQQKVQFVASVIHGPELLILDEPFSGLDPVNARLMAGVVREINDTGATIIFSTHQMVHAEALCDRVILIHRGEKLLDATLDDIRSRFDPRTVVVEPLGAADSSANGHLQQTLAALPGVDGADWNAERRAYSIRVAADGDPQRIMASVMAAAPVRSIELSRVTLDDVFVELVGGGPKPSEGVVAHV